MGKYQKIPWIVDLGFKVKYLLIYLVISVWFCNLSAGTKHFERYQMTPDEAEQLAADHFAKNYESHHQMTVVSEYTQEFNFGFIVRALPKKQIKSKNPRDGIPGGGSVIVDRANRQITEIGSLNPDRVLKTYKDEWEKQHPTPTRQLVTVKISDHLRLKLPCPYSIGFKTKQKIPRSCTSGNDGQTGWLKVAKIDDTLAENENIAPYQNTIKLLFQWLPKIHGFSDLQSFMLEQKEHKIPRYVTEQLGEKLQKIRRDQEYGQVYDLSLDYFDPREPNHPDIFILLNSPKGLVWIKNAGHLKFDYGEVEVFFEK